MSKRIFTKEQREELLKNENVSKCSERSISYSQKFKKTAVELYDTQGLTSGEIFRQAGFSLNTIGRDTPKECLKRWRKTFQLKGMHGFIETRGKAKGGGRPKTKNLTDADKIKRLEAENAYLKAENDFLAKLRAKRRE